MIERSRASKKSKAKQSLLEMNAWKRPEKMAASKDILVWNEEKLAGSELLQKVLLAANDCWEN